MAPGVRAVVLTGFGINCASETAHAFRLAGAEASSLHLNDLVSKPSRMAQAQIFAVPGGFSFGDDVASGRILANRLRFRLGKALQEFISSGKLVIGICNGFQVLVKMGLLPRLQGDARQSVTLTHNNSGRFEDRWVNLLPNADSRCVWTRGLAPFPLPARHGEGRLVAADEGILERLQRENLIALRYANEAGAVAGGAYPANPNGSVDDIAGICDSSGRIFGLMPHPEAYTSRLHHPRWTREALPEEGAGLQVFRNAVAFAREHLL